MELEKAKTIVQAHTEWLKDDSMEGAPYPISDVMTANVVVSLNAKAGVVQEIQDKVKQRCFESAKLAGANADVLDAINFVDLTSGTTKG